MASTSETSGLNLVVGGASEHTGELNGDLRKHETYYIPSGDVVFRVENTLFRVHKFFFERESPIFRDMLSLPAPMQEPSTDGVAQETLRKKHEGSSDENPIHLPQVSAEEFAHFLWVFYNPKHSDFEAPVSTWKSVLRLAHLWDFPQVRDLAFKGLEREPASTRLALGERYDAPVDWRTRAMTELATRREPLSRAEGEELGLDMVLKIAEMREDTHGGRNRHWNHRTVQCSCGYYRAPSPILVPPPQPYIPPQPQPPPIIINVPVEGTPPQHPFVIPPHPPSPPPHPEDLFVPADWPGMGGGHTPSRTQRILQFFKKALGKS